jgi:distribution and morphology protein 31
VLHPSSIWLSLQLPIEGYEEWSMSGNVAPTLCANVLSVTGILAGKVARQTPAITILKRGFTCTSHASHILKAAELTSPSSLRSKSLRSLILWHSPGLRCSTLSHAAETQQRWGTSWKEHRNINVGLGLDRRKGLEVTNLIKRQLFRCRSERGYLLETRRYNSSSSDSKTQKPSSSGASEIESRKARNASEASTESSGNPTTNRHLIDRLPSISSFSRPSKEELLAAATGFWSRLKIRFKWFSIRSVRPFNADEIGAFFTWVIAGHILWLVLGTTTFLSLAILAINTVFAQETLARWIGNYLTKSSGIKVVFESAIVPKWGDGVITFKNVFVSRRPGQGTGRVSKGSPETAAAVAAATAIAGQARDTRIGDTEEEEDTNYTQFDVSLDAVNVTLSFSKWWNSKGLLKDVEVKGVRGVVDRTHVHYPDHHVDPRTYKHEHNPGDFEIDSFKMEDLLVTVHQPHGFRPFSISIFSCDLPRLRKQYLFYDFLSANTMSGSFDESLFTIHPRQLHGFLGSQSLQDQDANGESAWKRHSRIRIDGLNIDHLNRGVEGPFSWIHKGNVDIVADIMFPSDGDESIAKVMSDFYDRMEATVTSKPLTETGLQSGTIETDSVGYPSQREEVVIRSNSSEDKRFLVMDLRVHLNDIRAAVPLFTRDISYVSNALIRPIVAYMNSRHTFIPINCRVIKRVDEFDGSWTIFDSGLMDDLSAEVSRLLNSSFDAH